MHQSRNGSMLLLCIALVATASVIAFGFVTNARSSMVSAEVLTRAELARAAARMGARHALEVALAEQDRPFSTGEWSLGQFGHLDRDVAANSRPWAKPLNNDGTLCTYNDSDDNVRAESALYMLHHVWYGDQGFGQAYRNATGDWPWADPADRCCAILNPCIPRWIEPGYYNSDGLNKPVRFTQVPTSTPDHDAPAYFDERWRPVPTRAQARYRLRYAVAAMDLGGHIAWGRQLDFDATKPFTDPAATPYEWDERTARAYQKSLVSMWGKNGIHEYISSNGTMPRSSGLSMYLGRGTSATNNWSVKPENLLVGFSAGPTLLPYTALNTYTQPGFIIQTGNNQTITGTGGPMSWYQARTLTTLTNGCAWWAHWGATPFGSTNQHKASPSRYYESAVDTPWRVNLLTSPADVIQTMLYGYLPQVVLKQASSSQKKYAWVGYVPGAYWYDPPVATWAAAPYATISYSPPAPVPPGSPVMDIQTRHFSPPSIAPAQPFTGFEEVDYSASVTATTYDLLYPGPPADWEEYAALELDTSKTTNDGSSGANPIHGLTLGSRINVWHMPDGTFDSGRWKADGDLRRRGLLSSGGKINASLEGAGFRDYGAMPCEPMRGSNAYISFSFNFGGSTSTIGGDKIDSTQDGNRPFYHRDSYWLDVLNATAEAVTLAKGLYMDPTRVGTASQVAYKGATVAPPQPTHIRDIDRSMLAILGEWFPGDATTPGSSTTCKPGHVLVHYYGGIETKAPSPRYLVDWLCSANIAGVKAFLATAAPAGPALPADQAARKAANMERVLNDWRMSFFGANPTYTDFAGLDFDGDGKAIASFYTGSVTVGGKTYPGHAATAGVGPPPDLRFSLTGFFVLDRTRYVRALVRGQVWDELRRQSIEDANLETVFAIDPDGNYNPATKAGLDDTCTLYQHWMSNWYGGESVHTLE